MIIRLLAFSDLEIRRERERERERENGIRERRSGSPKASWQLRLHPSGSFNWKTFLSLPLRLDGRIFRGQYCQFRMTALQTRIIVICPLINIYLQNRPYFF